MASLQAVVPWISPCHGAIDWVSTHTTLRKPDLRRLSILVWLFLGSFVDHGQLQVVVVPYLGDGNASICALHDPLSPLRPPYLLLLWHVRREDLLVEQQIRAAFRLPARHYHLLQPLNHVFELEVSPK